MNCALTQRMVVFDIPSLKFCNGCTIEQGGANATLVLKMH
jgi:hypothetical protein